MAINFKNGTPKEAESEFLEHLGGAASMISKQAVGSVSVTNKAGKSLKNETEVVHKGVLASVEQMCQVYAGGSHTINLGNYESAKVSVGITVPCLKADIDDTYEFATNWVSEKITEAATEIKG